MKALPMEAQFSMMSGILYRDYDGDGNKDILLTGNFYPFRVQEGRCDASFGSLLRGDGKGGFLPAERSQTGLHVAGDVRDMLELKGGIVVVSKNSGAVQVLKSTK